MEGVLEEDDEQQDGISTAASCDSVTEPTSRRARLAALSSRMKKEFGHTSDIALDGENWLKNLHPWHKRILFKPESPNESPSEASNGSESPSRLPNNDHNIESTPSTSKYESPQMIESVSRRARLAALTNRMRKEFDNLPETSADENDSMTRSLQPFYRRVSSRPETPEPSKTSQEIINPPPSEPPPPLPAMELRSPPPLPPRNPSIQLPMPCPVEQTHSEKAPETSTASGSRQTSINSAESVCTKNEETNCVKTDDVKKKRGHMKTLSLDRDFSFAKPLRSSPYPPSSNKSNSLTRQAGAEQEEELRIIEAEGVINEITSDLQISEKEILDSDLPCSSSIASINGFSILDKPKTILEKVDEGRTPDSELESPAKKIEVSVESSASLPISDHLLTLSSSPKAPLDPISRDVERRLSMKFDRSLVKDLPDDTLSGHSSIRSSSIDHAKVLARTASNYASSIFRGAINKVKQVAHTGSHSSNENDEETTDSDGEHSEAGSTTTNAVVRPRKTKKGPFDFQHLKIVQEINNEHTGAVWCIKFSACGRLLATAGADCVLRVWCLTTHVQHFQGMRERYQQKMDYDAEFSKKEPWETFEAPGPSCSNADGGSVDTDPMPIFAPKPFASYKGHVADILDLSWSKNYFILSSGMDRTAKLWHISRNECLCCFQHQDFVTSVSFLPKDDRYFVSGSLDGRMRIWNIPEKKVVFWNEVEEKLITALTFVKNGKFIVVGTYYGKCYFYTSELKYHTVISTRGRNSMGNKVTGLSVHGDKLLVTFNDSRIHMYDIRDKVLICKFRGAQHERSQIRASFSPDGRHVVSGSEDKFIYLWRTSDAQATRRDRNTMWERVRAHKTTVTVALFAPDPQLFLSNTEKRKGPQPNTNVIASADLDGSIKVMLNRATPKDVLTNLPLETVPEVDAPLTDNRANSLPKVNF